MTKKEKLVWRLGKLPTVSELTELVANKIITQEEAREILLNKEEYEDRDTKSYQEEIKFLRELVEKLSHLRSDGYSVIYRYIETLPATSSKWMYPYVTWCNNATSTDTNVSFSLLKTF